MSVELFDRLLEADRLNQRHRELREKRVELSNSRWRACGKCHWWMKSRDCPAEKNVNGMSRGPSCSDTRAARCSKFMWEPWALEHTENLRAEVAQLEHELNLKQ